VIVAIATKESVPSRSSAAPSAELAPALPPTVPLRPSDEAPGATNAPSATALPEEAAPSPETPDESTSNLAPAAASRAGASTPPVSASEVAAASIRIRIANPRPGLRVTVDGRPASLPVRLPRDQKSHVLAFTAPNFKPETKTVVADQDRTLTLEYRPKLYVP